MPAGRAYRFRGAQMPVPVRASGRDLRALAGIVSERRPDIPDRDGLPASLLVDLASQGRCDAVAAAGFDSERQQTWFLPLIPGLLPGPDPVGAVATGIGCIRATTVTVRCAAIPIGPASCAVWSTSVISTLPGRRALRGLGTAAALLGRDAGSIPIAAEIAMRTSSAHGRRGELGSTRRCRHRTDLRRVRRTGPIHNPGRSMRRSS
jgi:hypothetical protein